MDKKSRGRSGIGHLLTAFSIVLLINVCGLAIFYYDFIRSLQHRADTAVEKSIMMLDQVFRHVDQANETVLSEVDGRCEASLLLLREQVALVPFVRTINLSRAGRLYCSSLLGAISAQDEPADDQHAKLIILSGSSIRQKHPLVVVRRSHGQDSALSAVDGLYIKMILNVARDNLRMHFRVGADTLDDIGVFNSSPPKGMPFISSVKSSIRNPFSVGAAISHQAAWSLFQHDYLLLVIGLGGFSIIVFFVFLRVYNKPVSFQEELQRGVREHEFIPFFQPLVDAKTKQIMGVEVLMRWQHPQEGLVRPDLFIPQAESSGLIIDMTSIIIKDVAHFFHINQDLFPAGFHIGFNITAAHLESDVIINDCRGFQAHSKDKSWQLVLELTERSVLSDTSEVITRLQDIVSLGVELALDDFGTGHSSLTTLQAFNFHTIKIDQSFVSRIGDEPSSQHIVDSVIILAQKMGLTLVAEGVETQAQAVYLHGHGVNYLQGYLYGAPMNACAFLEYMQGAFTNINEH